MKIEEVLQNQRLNAWSQIVQACRSSGKSVSAWCIKNNINEKTYYYRQRKVCAALPENCKTIPADSHITQFEFDCKWNLVTKKERELWDVLKIQYPIGKVIECKVKYSYPQGWVLDIGMLLGIYICTSTLYPNELISGEISGYDEVNMWVLVSTQT